jgi:ABC-type multidrug transport system ATPase subunit
VLDLKEVTLFIGSGEDVRPLLSDVSVSFPKGHFGAIIGPSGCGKSTMLKVITGIAPGEEEGSIFWNGRDVAEEDFSPSEIGYVPQFSIAHEELTVRECVSYAMRLRVRRMHSKALEEAVGNVLEEVGMAEFDDRLVSVLSSGAALRSRWNSSASRRCSSAMR